MAVTYSCSSCNCSEGGLQFEDKDKWNKHLDEEHEITCSTMDCRDVAAYKYDNGSVQPYFYCAECADRSWERNQTMRERIARISRTANQSAKTLPDSHPAEKRLREKNSASENAHNRSDSE